MYKQYFVGQSFLTGNKCYSVEKKTPQKVSKQFWEVVRLSKVRSH